MQRPRGRTGARRVRDARAGRRSRRPAALRRARRGANGMRRQRTRSAGGARCSCRQEPPEPGADFRHPGGGPANRMARAAAMHVAGTPGPAVQPAVHLRRRRPGQDPPDARGRQRAAGRPARRQDPLHPRRAVRLATWSRPTSARPSTSSRRYYHSLDLLLIDDVQFFASKDRTQEEFFNAFEALLAKQRAHLMTSDTYPEGAGRHRRAAGLALRLRPDGRDRAARAGDAGGDPDATRPSRRRRDAGGRRLLRRQERALQRARARRRAAQDPGVLALQPARTSRSSWRARR